jgi:hypothetical protein
MIAASHPTLRVKRFATFNGPSVFSFLAKRTNFGIPNEINAGPVFVPRRSWSCCRGGQAPRMAHPLLLRMIHRMNLADAPQDAAAAKKIGVCRNSAFPDPQLLAHYPSPARGAGTC